MTIQFHKYHGAGNDFIIVDNRSLQFDKTNLELIKFLCDRHFGIGSDGLILIENHSNLDFNMVFYNPDGSQSFCGNGSRCAISIAHKMKMFDKNCRFSSTDGEHEGMYVSDEEIHLKMHDVKLIEKGDGYYFINTGSPHYIKQVSSLKDLDVVGEGRKIRYSERFNDEGTNVNFVEYSSDNVLNIRTYERGVEDETLACGTGIVASAISLALEKNKGVKSIKVNALGGQLYVSFDVLGNNFENIWLIGPAKFVYSGEIHV